MEHKINFSHRSVLLDECIESLNIKPDGIYVDGTAGGGGHSLEIAIWIFSKRGNKRKHIRMSYAYIFASASLGKAK